MHSFGRGGGPLGVDLWARGFGLVPADLKPMSLWGWTRTQKLAEAGKLKAVRHFAVDYSGACGAPALIVTVDRMPPPPAAAVKSALVAQNEAQITAAGPRLRASASSSDAGGELILVAMTLQKGEAPKVSASVQGFKAEITVGKRRVTSDGERLSLAGK